MFQFLVNFGTPAYLPGPGSTQVAWGCVLHSPPSSPCSPPLPSPQVWQAVVGLGAGGFGAGGFGAWGLELGSQNPFLYSVYIFFFCFSYLFGYNSICLFLCLFYSFVCSCICLFVCFLFNFNFEFLCSFVLLFIFYRTDTDSNRQLYTIFSTYKRLWLDIQPMQMQNDNEFEDDKKMIMNLKMINK